MQDRHLVTISNNVQFSCAGDQSLLDSALSQSVVLEHSCKSGRCGICVARQLSGETQILKPEVSLSRAKETDGYILTCCRAPLSNIDLDVEDLTSLGLSPPRTLPARIDSIKKLTTDVCEITLRVPPASALKYRAGQYIDVIGPGGIRRSYSIANAPQENGKISLEIRKVTNGILSRYWFEGAQVNDLLRLEGPLGTFCLRPHICKNLLLLATGTGIAPVKAILEELSSADLVDQPHFENIYLYWGGRDQDDLYWRPEFPNLPLNFIPVLSRASGWSGRTGYVQQAVLRDQIDLSDSTVYACGSQSMIHSAKNTLIKYGLSPKQFYSDAFVSSS